MEMCWLSIVKPDIGSTPGDSRTKLAASVFLSNQVLEQAAKAIE